MPKENTKECKYLVDLKFKYLIKSYRNFTPQQLALLDMLTKTEGYCINNGDCETCSIEMAKS